jgi:hypothetical protein
VGENFDSSRFEGGQEDGRGRCADPRALESPHPQKLAHLKLQRFRDLFREFAGLVRISSELMHFP